MVKIKLPDVVVSEVLVKKAAALACTGADARVMSDQLGITQPQARDIMRRDDFKAALEEITDEVTRQAKVMLKSEFTKMSKEVIRVLYANLGENNLEAVKVVLKVLGFGEEEVKAADTNITVMLPGSESAAIEVKNDKV